MMLPQVLTQLQPAVYMTGNMAAAIRNIAVRTLPHVTDVHERQALEGALQLLDATITAADHAFWRAYTQGRVVMSDGGGL